MYRNVSLCLYDYLLAVAGGGSLVRDVMKSGGGSDGATWYSAGGTTYE
jgi:hypothetical protein